jgi:dTMP kinase
MIQHRCDETGAEKDIHESNKKHLESSYRAALYSAEKLGWIKIDCSRDGELRTREEIHAEIVERLSDLIPELKNGR